jgi:hypothetical protein
MTVYLEVSSSPSGSSGSSACGGVDFLSFSNEGVFVGFAYLVSYKKTTFVLYLAVDGSLRGKGYGSRVLSQIKAEKTGQRTVLNIEPLDEKAPMPSRDENDSPFTRGTASARADTSRATPLPSMTSCASDPL